MKYVRVFSTNKQSQLAFVKSLLIAAGIDYQTTNENLNLVHGMADGYTLMDVLVPKDRADEARELLKDLDRPRE